PVGPWHSLLYPEQRIAAVHGLPELAGLILQYLADFLDILVPGLRRLGNHYTSLAPMSVWGVFLLEWGHQGEMHVVVDAEIGTGPNGQSGACDCAYGAPRGSFAERADVSHSAAVLARLPGHGNIGPVDCGCASCPGNPTCQHPSGACDSTSSIINHCSCAREF